MSVFTLVSCRFHIIVRRNGRDDPDAINATDPLLVLHGPTTLYLRLNKRYGSRDDLRIYTLWLREHCGDHCRKEEYRKKTTGVATRRHCGVHWC